MSGSKPHVDAKPFGMNGRHTILVVDDTEEDLLLLRHAFQKIDLDASVQIVRSGREAMGYLSGSGCYADRRSYPMPRLLLLDLKLPMMNGFGVLSWLRSQ